MHRGTGANQAADGAFNPPRKIGKERRAGVVTRVGMRRLLGVCVLALLLSGCGAAPQWSQRGVTKTQATITQRPVRLLVPPGLAVRTIEFTDRDNGYVQFVGRDPLLPG